MVSGIYRSRLSGETTESAAKFMSSMVDDDRIMIEDILGTMAHEIMLNEQGILSYEDVREILKALDELLKLRTAGKIKLDTKFEDVHEYVEYYVLERTSLDVGGRIHTGRSRNDQVALDQRMALRKELNLVCLKILGLIEVFLERANENSGSLMVGYTHTQHAQTTTLGHYLLAYVDSLFRDYDRIRQCYDRLNRSPLGASALAGSSFPLNRERTSELLGFKGLVENSIDAVSSRDFALESVACLAIMMAQLSRISEDLILWSSSEFGYVELDDAYASTSSVMPQKKNPCTLELIRGKTGAVYGELLNLFTTAKGLMTGYNRDLQEMKKPLWISVDTTKSCLEIIAGVVQTLKVNRERMFEVASKSHVVAIDLAEALVREGLPFRQAHQLVGTIVRESIDSNRLLKEISSKEIEDYSKKILGREIKMTAEELKKVFESDFSLSSRRTLGSPNPDEINRMINHRKDKLRTSRGSLEIEVQRLESVFKELLEMVKSIIG